jgi:hypothetical protein
MTHIEARQLYMIDFDELTFAQSFCICFGVTMLIFFACNLMNYHWVFLPM